MAERQQEIEGQALIAEAKRLPLKTNFGEGLKLTTKIIAFRFKARTFGFEFPAELEVYLKKGELL